MKRGIGRSGRHLDVGERAGEIVASAVMVEGTGLVAGRDYLPADTAAEFAKGMIRLPNDPEFGHVIADSAARVASERFSREVVERQLDVVFGGYLAR